MKTIKSSLAVVVMVALLAGCAGWESVVQDQWGKLAVKNAARALGYAVGNSKSTVDDTAVAQAYNLLRSGQTDPTAINSILSKWNNQQGGKLLVFAALDLLEAMGATIQGGLITELAKIPPELWVAVEIAYQQGFEMGLADKSAKVTRAVP